MGVDHGRRAALVLPELGQYIVGGRDVKLGQLGPQPLGDRPLVGRVLIREQQADRDRLGFRVAQLLHQPAQLGLAERFHHSLGTDAFGDAEPQRLGDQRRRLGGAEPVEVGSVLAPDVEQVGEPAGGDQRRPGAGAGEQRVGADGHSVGEAGHLARPRPGPLERRGDRREHPGGLIVGSGRRLRRVQRAAVIEDSVGERPADVDPEQHRVRPSARGAPDRRGR